MRPIDADAAVERLQRRSDMFRFDKRYEAVMRDAIGEVLTAPTLDAVPVVHARWIYYGEVNEDGNCEANCSACGAGDAHRADLKDAVPFCWKCGARMDGEADG